MGSTLSSSAEEPPANTSDEFDSTDDVKPRSHRAVRFRPRLVHGLLSMVALALIGGAVVGLNYEPGNTETADVAHDSQPGHNNNEAAGRNKTRPAPSPSDSPKSSEPSTKKPKSPNNPETEPPKQDDKTKEKSGSTAGCGSYSGAQATACGMLGDHGFGKDQMSCLVPMWDHESGWNTSASNPSGAYGIPQALPGDKMAESGSDWQNNAGTQIDWGLGYIKDRYGDPCGAWSFWQANNYY